MYFLSVQILDLPSQLFYKNKLSCKAKFPSGADEGPVDQPSVKFVCVEGQEAQDEDSPSYYNAPEAIKVAEEVREGGREGGSSLIVDCAGVSGSAAD